MISLVGEAYGENEERLGRPFVGAAGVQLVQLLGDSGLMPLTPYDQSMLHSYWTKGKDPNYIALIWDAHPEFHLTNVFNLHPVRNDLDTLCAPKGEVSPGLPALRPGKYLRDEFRPHLDRLLSELRRVNPSLCIALGNAACWALLGTTGVSKIRGVATYAKAIPTLKVIPTYHPAAILRQWDLRVTTTMDLQKAKRQSAFPEVRRPDRTVFIEPDLADLDWFYEKYISTARRIAIDIETVGDQISCIGFAPSTDIALTVPFIDYRKGGNYWPNLRQEVSAWDWVRRVCMSPPGKVFQNGLFDIHRLWRGYGIRVANCEDDTMLLSHSLHPESLKGLAYLGSIWTDEASWKLEFRHSKTIKKDN